MRLFYQYLLVTCFLCIAFVLLFNRYEEDVLEAAKERQEVSLKVAGIEEIKFQSHLSDQSLKRLQVVLELDQIKLRSRLSDLSLDDGSLTKAIQPGNPDRLKTVLAKALRGEDINLVVIGGSNSAGGKLGLDEKTLNGLYFKVFAKWWKSVLGNATKSYVREIPLTIGDTRCYFFAFCFKTFIAEGEKIDIALIEMSANEVEVKRLEQLTRQALAYFSAPAVLYVNLVGNLGLNSVSKTILNPRCENLENSGQTELARHYGITSFSAREILCRKKGDRWKIVLTNVTGSDGNHLGAKAHAQVAMMLIWYVREVLYDVINATSDTVNHVGEIDSSYLPKVLFIRNKTEILINPLCWTGKTPDIFRNLHRASLQVEVVAYNGFTPCFVVRGQKLNVKRRSKELRSDTQAGWCAWQRFSTLKLIIFVPPGAGDSLFRSRSVTVLSRNEGGEAAIWLDQNKNKAVMVDSKEGHDRVNTIATRVSSGYHSITVLTIRKKTFMVAGVFVGPPDFFSS